MRQKGRRRLAPCATGQTSRRGGRSWSAASATRPATSCPGPWRLIPTRSGFVLGGLSNTHKSLPPCHLFFVLFNLFFLMSAQLSLFFVLVNLSPHSCVRDLFLFFIIYLLLDFFYFAGVFLANSLIILELLPPHLLHGVTWTSPLEITLMSAPTASHNWWRLSVTFRPQIHSRT